MARVQAGYVQCLWIGKGEEAASIIRGEDDLLTPIHILTGKGGCGADGDENGAQWTQESRRANYRLVSIVDEGPPFPIGEREVKEVP